MINGKSYTKGKTVDKASEHIRCYFQRRERASFALTVLQNGTVLIVQKQHFNWNIAMNTSFYVQEYSIIYKILLKSWSVSNVV